MSADIRIFTRYRKLSSSEREYWMSIAIENARKKNIRVEPTAIGLHKITLETLNFPFQYGQYKDCTFR